MVAKAKAALGGVEGRRLILPTTEEQAVALLAGFNLDQLALLVKATQLVREKAENSPSCDQDARGSCG